MNTKIKRATVAPSASTPAVQPSSSAVATPTAAAEPFPIEPFAAISEDPVPEELAARFQAALEDAAARSEFGEQGGMAATVMTADGTWSGVVGKADDARDLRVDDQFAIASITKSVVAAQVMSMVESGELGLDDLAADHLPPDLEFDTNGATIRQLLSHRSGIPDDYDAIHATLRGDPSRAWTPADVLEQIPTWRDVAGRWFEYSGTNYLLLGRVIEHELGRPVAEVLREGVLAIHGIERLVLQPDEMPTEPMAMPGGQSTAVLESGAATSHRSLPHLHSVRREALRPTRRPWRGGGERCVPPRSSPRPPSPRCQALIRMGRFSMALTDSGCSTLRTDIPEGQSGTGRVVWVHVVGRVPARGRSGDRRAEQSGRQIDHRGALLGGDVPPLR